MPTINAGASTAVTVAVGTYLEGTGAGMAVIGPAAVVEPLTAGDAWQVGPFDRATLVSITAGSPITYTVRDNMRDPSEADKLPVASVASLQALVSQDGILPRADTEFPAERVAMTASGCVCASPCQIERIRCVTGTAVALTVYDNPAASSGTTLYSGTLSAGQEAAITTPIRAINGVRAVFASGSFDVYVSQEL